MPDVNEVWSLASGRRIKCLTVTDDFSHECVDIAVDHGIGGAYIVHVLDQMARFRGSPQAVRQTRGQRSRVGPSWPGAGQGRAPYSQPAGQAHAERLHRELQRQVPRRAPGNR
jgi:putative transposase